MKVLWLTNFPLIKIAKKEGLPLIANEGWIQGLEEAISEMNCCLQIIFVFPQTKSEIIIEGDYRQYRYYGYYRKSLSDQSSIQVQLDKILKCEKPDLVHMHGTEFKHSLSMLEVMKRNGLQERVVVSIQGLSSICGEAYLAGLPEKIVHSYSFRDVVRRDNIFKAQQKMLQRGECEKEVLKNVSHVIGRTEFDYACCKHMNRQINYHFCGEVLRNTFYHKKWDIAKCQKNSIFISQGYYPIKGLHIALKALEILKHTYKDAMLYVGGANIVKHDNWRDKLKISSYGAYIRKLIRNYNLENNIVFCGVMTEEQMCERYLSSNVFLSSSAMENSSNSIGEAMLLGMPVVASLVGGTASIITHKKEGYLYQWNEPHMLAYYISCIFGHNDTAITMAQCAYNRAKQQYDRDSIVNQLLDIYHKVDEYGGH